MDERRIHELAAALLARRDGGAALLQVRGERLRGGISAEEVLRLSAAFLDGSGRRRTESWVVKELRGPARREAGVYVQLAAHPLVVTPRLVSALPGEEATTLVLGWVAPAERWPWRDGRHSISVLRLAAALHRAALRPVEPWDYDGELRASAAQTLEAVDRARRGGAIPIDGASARAVRRLLEALPELRRTLRAGPYPPTLIHGDLHPGNVIVARQAGAFVPRLVDWGRARLGSPLEDVASWIQSLGCWEPAARRRHDTLLAAYVRLRGGPGAIPAELRDAHWLAGASNALAGALAHHLGVASDPSAPRPRRARALWAVHDWLRIIRRAAATWREPRRPAPGARDRRTPPPAPALAPTPAPRATRSPGDTRSTART